MKLALIPPIELLEYTDETFCQLMLPHLIESDVYTYVYKKHCEDPHQWVILDNGVAESEIIAWDRLYEIASDFGVDEMVIPDVLFGWQATIDRARAWHAQGYVTGEFKQMFVAQGKTVEQFKICIDWALEQPWIETIGLPRHALATCDNKYVRSELARYIQMHPKGAKPIHLLGASPEAPEEISLNHWSKCVRSTDTSSPFNFANSNKSLRKGNVVKRPNNYFNLPQAAFPIDLTNRNVQKLMNWTGNDL